MSIPLNLTICIYEYYFLHPVSHTYMRTCLFVYVGVVLTDIHECIHIEICISLYICVFVCVFIYYYLKFQLEIVF